MKTLRLFLAITVLCLTVMAINSDDEVTRHWNSGRGYEPFMFATRDGIVIENQSWEDVIDYFEFEEPAAYFNLRFRSCNLHSNPSKRYPFVGYDGMIRKKNNPEWGFFGALSTGDTVWFTVSRQERFDMISSTSGTLIRISLPSDAGFQENEIFTAVTDSHGGVNIWNVSAGENEIILSGGHTRQEHIFTLPLKSTGFSGFGFFAGAGGAVEITDIALSTQPQIHLKMTEFDTPEKILERLENSDDPLEGIYVMFDRDLDESLLKPGGDYQIAVMADEAGYEMIYLNGATINSHLWKTGMHKGFLKKTPFNDVFDAQWIDAEGRPLANGMKAQTGDGNTITLQFPYHSSSLRLRKIPGPED